jgi:hypothetical protein
MFWTCPFLAEANAAFTGNTVFVLSAIGGGLISGACSIIGLIIAARRNPPMGEQMYKEFARLKDVDVEIQRVHKRVDESNDRVDKVNELLSKNQHDAERARGRLEGKLDMLISYMVKGARPE